MTNRESAEPAVPVTPDAVPAVSAQTLSQWLDRPPSELALIDLANSATYARRHLPGAWFAIRAQLAHALQRIPAAQRYVVTGDDVMLAAFAASDLKSLLGGHAGNADVCVLAGGNAAWIAAGLPVESCEPRYAVPPIDRYRRPYEGTEAPERAMQDYLEWEYGLVAQLARDGTHGFKVLAV